VPLTLVTTAGAANANAYVDLVDVQAVAAYRGPSGEAFLDLTEDQQVQAIATVAQALDPLPYLGEVATEEQALAWPRTGTPYSGIPSRLKRANIEGAIALHASFTLDATTSVLAPVVDPVKSVKAGAVEVEFFTPSTIKADDLSAFPIIVQRLVTPLLRPAPVSGYGSSTAVRRS
jgi:hypothetical protein